jgi:hypothetical protein
VILDVIEINMCLKYRIFMRRRGQVFISIAPLSFVNISIFERKELERNRELEREKNIGWLFFWGVA